MIDPAMDSENPAEAMLPGEPGIADPSDPVDDRSDECKTVKNWLATIDEDLEFHGPAFKRMEKWEDFAKGKQWPDQSEDDPRYVCDITQATVRSRVNALYAKNPSIVAKVVERMDFTIWDESFESLQAALQNMQAAQQGMAPPDPMAQQLLADVQQGMQKRELVKKMGRTLEIVMRHQLRQQMPLFKREMKRMLRRQEINGVAYIKLQFMRESDVRPDIETKIGDLANRLAEINHMIAESQEEGEEFDDAEKKQLEMAIQSLHEQKYILKKEGLIFNFPRSHNIIPGKNCTQLEGFIAAGHVSERFWMTDDEIEKTYNVDLEAGKSGATEGRKSDKKFTLVPIASNITDRLDKPKGARDVFLVHDTKTGAIFTICRDYEYFLQEPAAPEVITEQFYPYYPIAFRETEDNKCIFPRSTVELIMHPQKEINRSKESLRQHRIAMKPAYAAAFGSLDMDDKKSMADHEAHEIIELTNLQENQSVDTKLQMIKKHPIDPQVYETGSNLKDIQIAAGVQPANLNDISGGTATEATISETSHESDTGSNADDQDDILSWLMRDAGHNLLINMHPETVMKIAGAGAIWPANWDDEIIGDIYLDIVAGSSGRPNKALKGAQFQRLAPLLMQIPGVRPEWLGRLGIQNIDESVDIADAFLEGLPAIIAQSRMQTGMGGGGPPDTSGDPTQDPNQQGDAGAQNQPVPPQTAPPGLPGMPGAGGNDAGAQRGGGMLSAMRRLMMQKRNQG